MSQNAVDKGSNLDPGDYMTSHIHDSPNLDGSEDSVQTPGAIIEKHGHVYERTEVKGGHVQFGDIYRISNYPPASEKKSLEHDLFNADRPVYTIPRKSSPYFTGRALQLEQTRLELTRSLTGVHGHKVVVVYGLGGSGKTQFCLRFCEEYRTVYRGLFWLDASSRSTSADSYAQLGELFQKGRNPGSGKFWLSTFPRPWLLVIDNADDPDLDLSTLLPPGNAGHILITTRNPHVAAYATIRTIRLTKMDPDEAIELLLRSAYPEDERLRTEPSYISIASRIAERLGYLAIAIHQAGSTVRRRICTLEKYLTSYLGQRGLLLGPHTSLDKDRSDIITTWEIPFRVVEAKQSIEYRDAVAVLHVMAFLHYEAIPEWLMESAMLWAHPSSSTKLDLPDILRATYVDEDTAQVRLRQALSILYDYSIIDLDSSHRVCSLHPVVHEWARSRISATGKVGYWLRCTAYVLSCSSLYSENVRAALVRPSTLSTHVDSFIDVSTSFGIDLYATENSTLQMERIASVYENAGRWRDALKILLQVLQTRTRSQRPWQEDTLRIKRKASMCYWNLFEVEHAIRLQLQIAAARWVVRPSIYAWMALAKPAHTEYLLSLSDLTQTLWLGGVHSGSRMAGERAMSGLRRNLGPGHLLTLQATFNLARTYRHIGMLKEAHALLVIVFQQRRQVLGIEHPDTLMSLNELGMSFKSRHVNLALAERLVRKALEIRKRVLGAEHAYTLWSVNDLAKVLSVRGRHAEAASILEEAIPAVIRTLGNEHVGMQMTKGNLARAYSQLNKWEESERLLQEIIGLMDVGHPDWLRSMIGCTRLQIRMGKLEKAEVNCRVLLETLDKWRVPIHKSIMASLWGQKWKDAAGQLAGHYLAGNRDSVSDRRAVAGLLLEVYRRGDRTEDAAQIRIDYPGLDENALNQPFELT